MENKMDKVSYAEKIAQQESVAQQKMQTLLSQSDNGYITTSDSPYHLFELEFGSNKLKEVNDFLFSLDKSEFRDFQLDPLLKICQKLLDWKVEVGSQHLNKVWLFTNVIKQAWIEVKHEYDIIETARHAHKNQYLDDTPFLPNEDPARWCAICDSFREFDALQKFGYPLPFNDIFGD